MKMHKLVTLLGLATVLAVAPACKKKADKAPEPITTTTGSAAGSAATGDQGTAAGSAVGSAAGSAVADENADHITVLGHHKNPKPTDPVHINFDKFKVVKADFDPKKVEGGKATIEIDLSSFHTDSNQRDGHLKSPAYLDVGKFATATIDIDNVKKKADNTYVADASVQIHGATKKYPVTFDVVETKDDSIKIKGEHTFPRLDFGIGTDPAQNGEEQVGTDLTIQIALTLKKT
ncbi:MAG: YceI family protein [Myxococcales bacterium]|nr:YceI family protein [Myxococcales bacterium]